MLWREEIEDISNSKENVGGDDKWGYGEGGEVPRGSEVKEISGPMEKDEEQIVWHGKDW